MSRRARPLALRTRLLLAVVSAVGLTLVVLVVAFNVILARSLDHDARETLRARAEAEAAVLVIRGGVIVPPDDPSAQTIDTSAWVLQGERVVRRPAASSALDAQAVALAGAPGGFRELDGLDRRLYVLPVSEGGRRIGTVVTAISLEAYERTQLVALIASIALAAAVLAAVAVASALILRAALRPVSSMTADAAAWSETDLDRRFAAGPPHDEITQLAATLDGLLDRLDGAMRRERRLTAEVSHELRTPLAQIQAEAELALRRDRAPAEYRAALEAIRAGADRLTATIETLLATARQETAPPGGTGDARRAAAGVVAACSPAADGRGVRLGLSGPAAVRAGVEDRVIERILQPIVENAVRHARGSVAVAVGTDGREVLIEVHDDGPGVPEGEREDIFEPGARGAANGDPGPGAGLGLSLARRLARAAGGDVEAGASGNGGLFLVRVPAA